MCLSSTSADRVPTSQSGKMILEEAGLGEKTVTVPDVDCSPQAFHQLSISQRDLSLEEEALDEEVEGVSGSEFPL